MQTVDIPREFKKSVESLEKLIIDNSEDILPVVTFEFKRYGVMDRFTVPELRNCLKRHDLR